MQTERNQRERTVIKTIAPKVVHLRRRQATNDTTEEVIVIKQHYTLLSVVVRIESYHMFTSFQATVYTPIPIIPAAHVNLQLHLTLTHFTLRVKVHTPDKLDKKKWICLMKQVYVCTYFCHFPICKHYKPSSKFDYSTTPPDDLVHPCRTQPNNGLNSRSALGQYVFIE